MVGLLFLTLDQIVYLEILANQDFVGQYSAMNGCIENSIEIKAGFYYLFSSNKFPFYVQENSFSIFNPYLWTFVKLGCVEIVSSLMHPVRSVLKKEVCFCMRKSQTVACGKCIFVRGRLAWKFLGFFWLKVFLPLILTDP